MNDDLVNAVYDPEVGFAYDPISGRLWRVQEIETTKERSYDERIVAAKVNTPGNIAKVVTHIMYRLMTGKWPEPGQMIDHEDGYVFNMVWGNLRGATPQQNAVNRLSNGRTRFDTDHLAIGVYRTTNGSRFMVMFGKVYYGMFKTAEEANTVAIAKRQELYGNFVRRA